MTLEDVVAVAVVAAVVVVVALVVFVGWIRSEPDRDQGESEQEQGRPLDQFDRWDR